MTFRVKFWGVRGSIAVCSTEHVKYGGNTSCIEVNAGDHHLILDAGTGMRFLGLDYLRRNVQKFDVLLTHTHWDHINGFPFFVPAYDPKRSFSILAGHLSARGLSIREVLASQMTGPMFPVPLETMQAKIDFQDFESGDEFRHGAGVMIRTTALLHPNNATGYRIEYNGKALCYVTDTEHVPGQTDENVLALIEGADLVIYDSTYTEAEFPSKIGWGHSTWNEGVRLCRLAKAKRLAIFHHEPNHEDSFMDRLAEEAESEWSGAFVARDFQEFILD